MSQWVAIIILVLFILSCLLSLIITSILFKKEKKEYEKNEFKMF
jgi:hypothetical protein